MPISVHVWEKENRVMSINSTKTVLVMTEVMPSVVRLELAVQSAPCHL